MNSFLSNVIKGIDNTNILADGGNSSEFTGCLLYTSDAADE